MRKFSLHSVRIFAVSKVTSKTLEMLFITSRVLDRVTTVFTLLRARESIVIEVIIISYAVRSAGSATARLFLLLTRLYDCLQSVTNTLLV